MHIQNFLELIEYRLSSADDYQWKCYGDKVKLMDFENEAGEEIGTVLFSTQDRQVREIYVYNDNEALRWIHPDYREAYEAEAKARKVNAKMFIEGMEFKDIDDEEEMFNEVTSYISPGLVRVKLTDEEISILTKMAKDQGTDFQTLINQIATDYLTKIVEEAESKKLKP
jgi:hypothetical protein